MPTRSRPGTRGNRARRLDTPRRGYLTVAQGAGPLAGPFPRREIGKWNTHVSGPRWDGTPMPEGGLHVVFGTGQVGLALAGRLAGGGLKVRAVTLRRPVALADGVDWRAADATDLDAAADAAKGASAVYQCLNAPYTRWPDLFPPLQQGALAAAERAGALLVTLENVYAYGPTGGNPITEALPLAPTTSKGRTRAAMTTELLAAAAAGRVRVAIGRASDFFGAGAAESTLRERGFGHGV